MATLEAFAASTWLALALSITGCASQYMTHDGTVCIDEATGAEHLDSVVAAADDWRRASSGRIDLSLRVTDEPDQAGCDGDLRSVPGVDDKHAAYTDTGPGHIPRMRVDWSSRAEWAWTALVAHELGHALGADDSADHKVVMHPKTTLENLHVTAADVAATWEN